MILHYDVIDGEYISAGTASGKLKKALKQLGINSGVIRKIAVAMYEAEINMVIHANGGTIDAEVTPEFIQVVLDDNGPGIPDIEQAMTAGYSTASREARDMGFGAGMGLPNIKRYSDHLHIESEVGKGTKVTIRVNLA